MIALVLIVLAQPAYPANPTAKQGRNTVDGGVAWIVEVAGGAGTSADSALASELRDGTVSVRVKNMPPPPARNALTGAAKVDGSGAVQPVSAAALPLPSNAAQEDGGVLTTISGQISTLTAVEAQGWMRPPLNPFLPRCNAVRKTGCQP